MRHVQADRAMGLEMEQTMQAKLLRYYLPLATICIPLSAQWINYPTPGIPRTGDGKPNLTAPAPKQADGKPDLTGVWRRRNDTHW